MSKRKDGINVSKIARELGISRRQVYRKIARNEIKPSQAATSKWNDR